jgi:hypothetical protein
MKSKIYRLAAKDLEKDIQKNKQLGCCWHISRASGREGLEYHNNQYIQKFQGYFKPDNDEDYYFVSISDEKDCLTRLIALDLMAEILKSEGE